MKLVSKIFIFTAIAVCSSCSGLHYSPFSHHSKPPIKASKPVNSQLESKNQEVEYVFGSEDIPLFAGLEFLEEESSSFDTIAGNIIISSYVGNFQLAEIKQFYLQTLPQLGWKLVKNLDDDNKIFFQREDDKLEIKFKISENSSNIDFFISSTL